MVSTRNVPPVSAQLTCVIALAGHIALDGTVNSDGCGKENEARRYIIKLFRSILSFNTHFSYDIAFTMSITNLEAQQVGVLVHRRRGNLYWDISSYGLKTLTNIIGILIYDHISTLPEEIAFIWYRPKTLSATLFFINRYVALLSNISHMLGDFLPISNKTLICIILFLRTYALYGRSKRLLKWMVIISLPLAAAVWSGTFLHDSNNVTDGKCHEIYTTVTSIRRGIAWLAMFILELLIFALTVFKVCKTRGLPRFFQISRRDILDVIFYDGVMYFAGMTLVNLSNILTYFCGLDITRGSLSTITSCMSVNLISRLMLNLHESMDTGIFSTSATTSIDILTTRAGIGFCFGSEVAEALVGG
ncbi:hypothetical protein BDR07DRAFT_1489832 [Suillus spraguei]|nr:hypothetical protein BDR07DRAFT_1489832 [Suillus spraguei]